MSINPFQFEDQVAAFDALMAQVSPNQQIRELVHNMFEAGATEGVITIDPDLARQGIIKLMFVDNGPGMSDELLEKYIGAVSAGAKPRGRQGNYGMGAKIASAGKNPFGVRYSTWTNPVDEGSELVFARDDITEAYGPRIFEDGELVSCPTIGRPDIIKRDGHGTCVTLMGESHEDSTAYPSIEDYAGKKGGGGKWINLYLNRRYYRFPDTFGLKAIDFTSTDRAKWGNPAMARHRDVHGAKYWNDRYSNPIYGGSHGVVQLVGAKARWWLLQENHNSHASKKEEGAEYLSGNPLVNLNGHFGFLYKDEIYDRSSGPGSSQAVRRFGILTVAKRVVIYIEPDYAQPDMGRVFLHQDGQPLPLELWQEEFCENMPDEIRDADREALKSGQTHLDNSTIEAYLKKQLGALPPPPRKVKDPNGNSTITGSVPGNTSNTNGYGGPGHGTGGPGTGNPSNPTWPGISSRQGTPSNVQGQVPASIRKPKKRPSGLTVVWVNEGNLEDYAAEYQRQSSSGSPAILLNKDYYLYDEFLKAAGEGRTSIPEDTISECLREQVGLRVATAISMIECLSKTESDNWPKKNVKEAALSREALTAAIEASRKDILDEMNKRLGKIQARRK